MIPEQPFVCQPCNDDRHPLAVVLEEAAAGDVEQWWWLSFADPERPEGTQFLGVAIVQAPGIVSAAAVAHRLNINPGGEVAGIPIPAEQVPADQYRNRLLTKQEIQEAGL